jgi:hypothetical protein
VPSHDLRALLPPRCFLPPQRTRLVQPSIRTSNTISSAIPLRWLASPSCPLSWWSARHHLSKTVADFVAYARANPSQATIGTTFTGSPVFMASALFKTMTGLQAPLAQHSSDAAGIADLLAGKVQTHFAGAGVVTEDVRSGKLRALGVTTLTRFDFLPDVPPIADAVPGYEASSWVGVVAPRGAPAGIVETLNREVNAGLIDAKVKARMREIGHVPMPMGAVEFGKFIAAETEKWAKVIRAAGIKADHGIGRIVKREPTTPDPWMRQGIAHGNLHGGEACRVGIA